MKRRPHWVVLSISLCVLLLGCASTAKKPSQATPERDPWQGYNRRMFAFNDALDRAFIKPLARGYQLVTPTVVDQGISNFFSNLNEVTVVVNDVFQLKFGQAAADTGRFLINSTVGIAGFFDVASMLGLEKHNEDFGQTLGYWGVPAGPYLVVPVLGPSTLRDAPTFLVDRYTTLWPYVNLDTAEQRGIDLISGIDLRADLFAAEKALSEIGFDRYATLRDAFLDRRLSKVYDGNPPQSQQAFDPFQELEMLEELEELDGTE